MKLRPVFSKKTGRKGYRGRYVDPVSGKRRKHTEWYGDKREAEEAWRRFLNSRQARAEGRQEYPGRKMTYGELVKKFLTEESFEAGRVKFLKSMFDPEPETNPTRHEMGSIGELLRIEVGADLERKGDLSARCLKLAETQGDIWVIKCVQSPLKQLSAWAASIDLFPYDPLASWKKIKRTSAEEKRDFFMPEDMTGILQAADDLDKEFNRTFPSRIIFETLLVTGNRPGAIFASKVGDFTGERIQLGAGVGNKLNGKATVTQELAAKIYAYLAARGRPENDQPLFVSPKGGEVDKDNIRDDWHQAATLAYVRKYWPLFAEIENVSPVDVALAICRGRVTFDGAPSKTEAKKSERAAKKKSIIDMAKKLKPKVYAQLKTRPMYALRHTHATWSRLSGVNQDSRDAQLGHAGKTVEEKHYFNAHNVVDAGESSKAVWEVLTGVRELAIAKKQREAAELAKAAGAESISAMAEIQPSCSSDTYGAKQGSTPEKLEKMAPVVAPVEKSARREEAADPAKRSQVAMDKEDNLVGAAGFEPATSCTPSQRASNSRLTQGVAKLCVSPMKTANLVRQDVAECSSATPKNGPCCGPRELLSLYQAIDLWDSSPEAEHAGIALRASA